MSWAVWNPEFVCTTIKNMVHTFKNSFQDIVAFWKECCQMASGSTWISLFVVLTALVVILLALVLIGGCVILFSPILLLFLTPLGVCSVCLVICLAVKAIKNDTFRKTRRFFRRVSWAFRKTLHEEKQKKRKEKKKKQFRVIEGGRKASWCKGSFEKLPRDKKNTCGGEQYALGGRCFFLRKRKIIWTKPLTFYKNVILWTCKANIRN